MAMLANDDATVTRQEDEAATTAALLRSILVELKVISTVLGESSTIDIGAVRSAYANDKDTML